MLTQPDPMQTVRSTFTLERLQDIHLLHHWRAGFGCCVPNSRPDVEPMNPDEHDAITRLWESMPGNTCFMDALLRAQRNY